MFKALTVFLCLSFPALSQVDNRREVNFLRVPDVACIPGKSKLNYVSGNAKFTLECNEFLFRNGLFSPLKSIENKSSLGPIGLWVGSKDEAGIIKLAASDPSAGFSDFSPGPLNAAGVTDEQQCINWDRFFTVSKAELLEHIQLFEDNTSKPSCDKIAPNIKYWPAKGNPFWKEKYQFELPLVQMASFNDVDQDGIYNPCMGDFPALPAFCYRNEPVPDDLTFWVFNDVGSPHRLTSGSSIQIQVNAYVHHYKLTDPVNDVIYATYQIINRGSSDMENTYVGLMMDAGMGCPYDDKIGIDPGNNLVYAFNSNVTDGINNASCVDNETLGFYPYLYALRYNGNLKGQKSYVRDSMGNIIKDSLDQPLLTDVPFNGESDTLIELGISSFQVFEANETNLNYLRKDELCYNLLSGRKFNGDAIIHDAKEIKYMYPGHPNNHAEWSMCSDTSMRGKKLRSLVSVGPGNWQPGQSNTVGFTIALVRNNQNCPDPIHPLQRSVEAFNQQHLGCIYDDYELLRVAHLMATVQPDSGNVKLEIVPDDINQRPIEEEMFWEHTIEQFAVNDTFSDIFVRFEGYQLYQIADTFLNQEEFENPDKARLIYQCDLQNHISIQYNYKPFADPQAENLGNRSWESSLMVNGRNKGIVPSVVFSRDQFANGNGDLEPGQEYNFALKTYYANNWKEFKPISEVGQRRQYLSGLPFILKVKIPNKSRDFDHFIYCYEGTIQLSEKLLPDDQINIFSVDGQLHHQFLVKSLSDIILEKNKIYIATKSSAIYPTTEVVKLFCH